MAATHLPYVATVAESNPHDFIKKAAKAAAYAREFGTAYVKRSPPARSTGMTVRTQNEKSLLPP